MNSCRTIEFQEKKGSKRGRKIIFLKKNKSKWRDPFAPEHEKRPSSRNYQTGRAMRSSSAIRSCRGPAELRASGVKNYEIINKKPKVANTRTQLDFTFDGAAKNRSGLKSSSFLGIMQDMEKQVLIIPSKNKTSKLLNVMKETKLRDSERKNEMRLRTPKIHDGDWAFSSFASKTSNDFSKVSQNNRYENCQFQNSPSEQDSRDYRLFSDIQLDKENIETNTKIQPAIPRSRIIDPVVENKVYPSLKPRTRSSLRSHSRIKQEKVEDKVKQRCMPPKTKLVSEQNPMFSTAKKNRYGSASKLSSSNMYHLSNVLAPTCDDSSKNLSKADEFDSYLYSTLNYTKNNQNSQQNSGMKTPKRFNRDEKHSRPKDFNILSGMVMATLIETHLKKAKRRCFITWRNQADRKGFVTHPEFKQSLISLDDLLSHNFK